MAYDIGTWKKRGNEGRYVRNRGRERGRSGKRKVPYVWVVWYTSRYLRAMCSESIVIRIDRTDSV